MKNKDYKSLEEVWEMKETVWEDFKKSGTSSYVDFIENEEQISAQHFTFGRQMMHACFVKNFQ